MEGTISPAFFVECQTGFIALNGILTHTYHVAAGVEVEHTSRSPSRWYNLEDTPRGWNHHYDDFTHDIPFEDVSKGWVGDRLWVPIEWRRGYRAK